MYHRQIYKHFLTNKILKNPQQRRFFKARDMKDLFILNDEGDSGATETANIFGQLSEDANVVCAQKDDHSTRESKKVTVPYANASAGKRKNSEIESSRRNGKEKADHSEGDVDEETNILKCLFDTQGIHVSFFSVLLYTYRSIIIFAYLDVLLTVVLIVR